MSFSKHVETNDNYPTAKQERRAMQDDFTLNTSAKLESIMDELCWVAQYLAECPGYSEYGDRAFKISEQVEELSADIKGDGWDSAA